MTDTPRRFRVALTGDFFSPDGSTKYPDIGLSVFDGQGHLEWVKFREHRAAIGADQLEGANGVIVLTPSVTARDRLRRAETCWRSAGSASGTTPSTWRRVPRPTSSSSSPPARSTGRWPRRPSAG